MRTIIVLFISFASFAIKAQSAKTETFTVKGNCEDCKGRIENAADIKGVKILTWDPDTKVASVTYNPEKTTLDKIQEAIAARGYDAGDHKGNTAAYNKLPNCCKYRDGKCEEGKK